MLRKGLFAIVLILGALSSRAQNSKTGTWGIVTVVMPGDSSHRWGGYMELQTRTNTLFNQAFYYEVKGGVSFDIDRNFTALVGTGKYVTYDYNHLDSPPTSVETRLWEQMTVNQFLSRIKIEHRYRVEQRFFESGYRNRFRYRLNMAIPINHRKIVPKTLYIAMFDEVFFNNKAPHFERNRFNAGLGYQFTKGLSVQAGWMNQYNYNLTTAGAKNNLAINVQYRITRKNIKPKEVIPSIHD